MKTTALSTYSQNQHTLQILDDLTVKVTLDLSPLGIPFQHLFEMAARINKKRSFLFVSKVLGKHIPVDPLRPLITSGLLAFQYGEQKMDMKHPHMAAILKGFLSGEKEELTNAYRLLMDNKLSLDHEPIVIGFAETATSLGQAVFDCFEKAYYIPTTREEVSGLESALTFEEEHSHAVDQRCYVEAGVLDNQRPIILVDDEMTTGKTALNIIKDIHSKFPRQDYTILSILDWRSDHHKEMICQLEKDLSIRIQTVSLLSGTIEIEGKSLEEATYDFTWIGNGKKIKINQFDASSYFTPLSLYSNEEHAVFHQASYIKETGRFGLTSRERDQIEQACKKVGTLLKSSREGSKTLCIGTGELMYLPIKISSFMGDDVLFHSTTRSPIHPIARNGYAIKNGFRFANPEDTRILHYVYNIPKNEYDEVFLFIEKVVPREELEPLCGLFEDRGIPTIHIVALSSEGSDLNE